MMIAASCVGYAADLLDEDPGSPHDFWDSLGQSNSWQYLAFNDSPAFDSPQMMAFYDLANQGHSNLYSWIQGLHSSPPDNFNQPIGFTIRNPVYDAAQPADYLGTRHELANFLTGAHLPPVAGGTANRELQWTYTQDDGDPLNDDPDVSDCEDNLLGN